MLIALAGLFTDDKDIISDSLWAINYLADTDDDNIIDEIGKSETVAKII